MKYDERGALLIKYKNEVDEQKRIAKEEADKYEMEKKKMQESHKAEMIAMEKQVRGLEEDKKHLLQQKISKQESSLIQGICNACVSQFVITVCMPFYVFFY